MTHLGTPAGPPTHHPQQKLTSQNYERMTIDDYSFLLLVTRQVGWLEVENVSSNRFFSILQAVSPSAGGGRASRL
jgi:hypothetical protein